MKKTTLLLVGFVLSIFIGEAQTTFGEQQNINTEPEHTVFIYTADIDGDGNEDILSASGPDNKISWYKNIDGEGTFSSEIIITGAVDYAFKVYACDIDSDGDNDVISASLYDNKIAWYENYDGNGNFNNQQIISLDFFSLLSIFPADIDGDDDIDILSSHGDENRIIWHENTDGDGTFWVQQFVTAEADWASSVITCDIDSDGDNDVLSTSLGDSKIAWYENTDGKGKFNFQNIISYVEGINNITTADLDYDGYLDLIAASTQKSEIGWYKNISGSGAFTNQFEISSSVKYPISIHACDIDGDIDQDLLLASADDGKISWYENTDGNGNFIEQQIITNSAKGINCIFASDIDNDGDNDILFSSITDGNIAWVENLTPPGDSLLIKSHVHPNPTNGIINIEVDLPEIKTLKIYDITGKILYEKTKLNPIETINISNFPDGFYIVTTQIINDISTSIIIKK